MLRSHEEVFADENRPDCTARGMLSAQALWGHGADRVLSHRGTGPPGPRGDVIRQRRLANAGETGSLLRHGASSQSDGEGPHTLSRNDARFCPWRGG